MLRNEEDQWKNWKTRIIIIIIIIANNRSKNRLQCSFNISTLYEKEEK